MNLPGHSLKSRKIRCIVQNEMGRARFVLHLHIVCNTGNGEVKNAPDKTEKSGKKILTESKHTVEIHHCSHCKIYGRTGVKY